MAKALKMTCLECGAVNRVPEDKISAGPKCGTCGTRINDGKVRALDPSILSKAIKHDDVPLLVDFWAPWCGPCRMMAPAFEQAAKTLSPTARLAKINTEDYPNVSQKHSIRGIPALILYQGGHELKRHAGAIPAPAIAKFVQQNAKR